MKKLVLLLIIAVSAFAQTVTDIDGNVYKTVTIGNQVWMAENLRTTRYNNGDPIPNVKDSAEWNALTSDAYCYYNNDPSNGSTYGGLYNVYSIHDSRGLAPAGWHIATEADWDVLINRLGGDSIAPGKLKEAGTTHWKSPNLGATNETGFKALPGGSRFPTGSFNDTLFPPFNTRTSISNIGFWWKFSGTSLSPLRAIIFLYNNIRCGILSSNMGGYAFSIRCVKDAPAVGVKDGKDTPLQFGLSQNYPNPFNPSTIISYSVGMNNNSSVLVQLTVYDVLGREIVCLVNEEKQPGLYQVKFDGTNLPNGIYYYKLVVSGSNPLQTEKYTEMKKMIFLK